MSTERRRQMVKDDALLTVLSPAEHVQIAKALGRDRQFESAGELLSAFEEQRRKLEVAKTRVRELEATTRRDLARTDELRALRDEVASLRSQQRLATRERDLDRRDEQEELAEKRRIAEALKIPIERVL